MDQQLDQYQESIKELWKRLKAGVFPGISGRHSRPLGLSLLLVSWLVFYQLKADLKFAFWVAQDFESLGMLLYSLFQPVPGLLAVVGVIMTLRLKRSGWVLIVAFFLGRVLWEIGSVFYLITYSPTGVEAPLLDMIDAPVTSWGTTLFWLTVFVLVCGFYASQPIKQIFKIERRQIIQAVMLTLSLKLVSAALVQVL